MASEPPAVRIASAPPSFVEAAPQATLADWLAYVDPDAVLLTGSGSRPGVRSSVRRALQDHCDVPIVRPGGAGSNGGPRRIGGVDVVVAPDTDTLAAIEAFEADALDTTSPTFVVSALLDLSVDTTTLTTTLVGAEDYRRAFPTGAVTGQYTHLSTRLPAGYRREWGAMTVVGCRRARDRADAPLVALECRGDGRVLTRTIPPSQLGVRALDGVGSTRAEHLRAAGIRSRRDVVDADETDLAAISSIGRATASRIAESARAVVRGEVCRRSDRPLPTGEPIFVDIETDGIAPTITWLIGVLDGDADDGTYHSFLQRDPDDPAGAVAAFVDWYATRATDRPVVAYNGRQFDFPVLRDHVREYCPEYGDVWAGATLFDPYHWAVAEDNAVLPGRTNQLDDVAAALGYERAGEGLSGAAVARTYRQWIVDRSPDSEPEWTRFDQYCEDDVRALAAVYDALQDSDRMVTAADHRTPVRESTTQGRLSDW